MLWPSPVITFGQYELKRLLRLVLAIGLLLWAATGLTVSPAQAVDLLALPPAAPGTIDFNRDIQPLLAEHCLECHGPTKQKSGFRLDRKDDAFRGGDLGKAILPGRIADSPLLHYVAGLVPDMRMPPKGELLSSGELALLRAWIEQGASWPDETRAPPETATWWSLRPLVRPVIPELDLQKALNPIDAFVRAELKEKGLPASPEADRRTLIRRLYFNLLGLPPTIEEVDRFVHDPAPEAYERLVDQLLASPHYGERWARHWLDVVHYGDTHGYDKDQPRPNAWPYRDYVIRSFNEDKPYARFVQEQIAGDVLFPGDPEGIEALGFIAAGPWDLIGHAEVPETKTDGKIARHLDRDDMVSSTISTFNSLTVHCAQCHNHKFDPIPAEDYYSLQAVFAALDRTDYEYYREPELHQQRAMIKAAERSMNKRKAELEQEITREGGSVYAELTEKIETVRRARNTARPPEFGYHSTIESTDSVEKWVQVDLGRSALINEIVLAPCWDDFAGIGAGFGFPPRFKVEVSDLPEFQTGVQMVHEQSPNAKNPGTEPQKYSVAATARYVRVTATRLAPRQNDFIFALAELEVWNAEGTNLAAGATVTALDSIENPIRWRKSNLVDGIYPGRKESVPIADLASLERDLATLIERVIPAPMREQWSSTTNQLARLRQDLAEMPQPKVAFIGAVHHGSGAFRGTGPDDGRPRPIHLLRRGDVRQPGEVMNPGALSAITELPARFELPASHGEGERRKALAWWLTDARHPLTWRSIVNRVWQYHFGRGLVETANDFGRMGTLPSHPELLDWLAVTFRDSGQSLKSLHRLIVTSATYRQVSSATDSTQAAVDSDRENLYLWRMNRRRLEAEGIRDAVLFVSRELDLRMFGPGFKDFVVEKPEHSPHYQYHLHDPADPQSHRRSIYRFIVRSQPQPFLATLDCADPSMLVDRRNESLTALQALALLNNGLTITMAEYLATELAAGERPLEEQVWEAFSRALSRHPEPGELANLTGYAQRHGLANTCRVLFNLNEFAFID